LVLYPDVVMRYKQGKNKECFVKMQYFLISFLKIYLIIYLEQGNNLLKVPVGGRLALFSEFFQGGFS
jgi:hypothetical protein